MVEICSCFKQDCHGCVEDNEKIVVITEVPNTFEENRVNDRILQVRESIEGGGKSLLFHKYFEKNIVKKQFWVEFLIINITTGKKVTHCKNNYPQDISILSILWEQFGNVVKVIEKFFLNNFPETEQDICEYYINCIVSVEDESSFTTTTIIDGYTIFATSCALESKMDTAFTKFGAQLINGKVKTLPF